MSDPVGKYETNVSFFLKYDQNYKQAVLGDLTYNRQPVCVGLQT